MPDVNAIEESLAERLLGAYQAFDMARLNDTMADIVSAPRTTSRSRQPQAQQLSFDFTV